MNAKAAKAFVTKMQTAPIPLGFMTAPAKKDLPTNTIKCMYVCVYIYIYIYGFSDIDECNGNHSCQVNATCTNTNGYYVCILY